MSESGTAGMWELPEGPPPMPPPVPPPTGTPTGTPRKQRKAHATQGLAVATSVGLALSGLASIPVIAAVRDRADAIEGLTFNQILAMDGLERQRVLEELVDADHAVGAAVLPYLLAALVTGVLWILWQRRIVRNAMPFGPIGGSIGWGSWGWFVPLANLYFPEAQLAHAARISDPDRLVKEGGSGASPFVYLWWAAWTGSSILSIGGGFTVPSPVEIALGTAEIDDLRRADLVQSIGFGLGVLAAVFGIAAVLHITQRQRAMLQALGVVAN